MTFADSSLLSRERGRLVTGWPVWVLLVVATILIAIDFINPACSYWLDLAAIVLLGIPHGALDAELARLPLRARWQGWWFGAFALPYLMIAGSVLIIWQLAPLATLAGFFALSVWHFGEGRGLPLPVILARGGAVIALPVLLHPTATATLLAAITQVSLAACPAWLVYASYFWLPLAGWVAYRTLWWRELLGVALLYAALTPLTALALYFACYHAPLHIYALLADRKAPRLLSVGTAAWYALPVTLLTLLIGALLWPFYPGAPPDRLLALTIQGLAALTLPHMLLGWQLDRRG